MLAYFNYLRSILLNKVSLWIVTGINWLYTLIILVIVPVCVKLAPMNIWNFEQISLQGTYIIINSIICAFIVVYIFRSGIEDQTELIIMSKPIKRTKILLAKFIWTIIFGLIISLGETLIALFTLMLGQYDPINNIGGMHYEKLVPLIGSLILGTMIVCLVFDSLGILISIFGNKVKIIISLVVTALVFNIYDIINKTIISSLSSTIKDEIGSLPKSFQIKTIDGKYNNFVYTQTISDSDAYELYKKYNKPINAVSSYLNFNSQLSKLYSSFGVNDVDYALCNKSFGEDSTLKTTITSYNDNLLNYYTNMFTSNDIPMSMPYYSTIIQDKKGAVPSIGDYGFTNIAMNCGSISFMKYLGATNDSIWISNMVKYLYEPSKYHSANTLTTFKKGNFDNFNKLVFNEIGINLLDTKSNPDLPLIVNDANSTNLQKTFTNLCFNFMKSHKTEFGFILDDFEQLNFQLAQIQFSLINTYLKIYWKQILPKIISKLEVTPKEFFINDNNVFKDSFKQVIEFNNPFDDSQVILSQTDNYHLYDFLHSYYAYSSCAIFNNSSIFTDYLYPNSTFGNNCHGIDLEGNPNSDDTFYSFGCSKIIFNTQICIQKMYNYTTSEYVDNSTSIIVWTTLCLILTLWVIYKYVKCDIS